MRQIKPVMAVGLAGAITLQSAAPTIAAVALGKAQCEVSHFVGAPRDCEGTALPPKASIPISVASSTAATNSTMTAGAMPVRFDAITDVQYDAGMFAELWGHPLAAQPPLQLAGCTSSGPDWSEPVIFIAPST